MPKRRLRYGNIPKQHLDMQHVRDVLQKELDAATRMKAAKVILFDSDHNPDWLQEMANPYSVPAAEAAPARVALLLLACGYTPKAAATRSVPKPMERVGSVSKSGSVNKCQ